MCNPQSSSIEIFVPLLGICLLLVCLFVMQVISFAQKPAGLSPLFARIRFPVFKESGINVSVNSNFLAGNLHRCGNECQSVQIRSMTSPWPQPRPLPSLLSYLEAILPLTLSSR